MDSVSVAKGPPDKFTRMKVPQIVVAVLAGVMSCLHVPSEVASEPTGPVCEPPETAL